MNARERQTGQSQEEAGIRYKKSRAADCHRNQDQNHAKKKKAQQKSLGSINHKNQRERKNQIEHEQPTREQATCKKFFPSSQSCKTPGNEKQQQHRILALQ